MYMEKINTWAREEYNLPPFASEKKFNSSLYIFCKYFNNICTYLHICYKYTKSTKLETGHFRVGLARYFGMKMQEERRYVLLFIIFITISYEEK